LLPSWRKDAEIERSGPDVGYVDTLRRQFAHDGFGVGFQRSDGRALDGMKWRGKRMYDTRGEHDDAGLKFNGNRDKCRQEGQRLNDMCGDFVFETSRDLFDPLRVGCRVGNQDDSGQLNMVRFSPGVSLVLPA
jgi:hypothetical protein